MGYGMSSFPLTFTPSFFRGVGQPPTRITMVFVGDIWLWVKTLVPSEPQNSWDLWMFIPLKIGIYRYWPIPISTVHRLIYITYNWCAGCHPTSLIVHIANPSCRRLHRARRAEAVAGTKGHLLQGGFLVISRCWDWFNIMTYIIYVWLYELYMWSYGIIYVFDIWCKLMYYMCVTLWWSNIWKITIRIIGKSSFSLSISIGFRAMASIANC